MTKGKENKLRQNVRTSAFLQLTLVTRSTHTRESVCVRENLVTSPQNSRLALFSKCLIA